MNSSQEDLIQGARLVSRNRVLREKVYRPMKRYLALTCQCWSIDENTSRVKLILYRVLKFVIACTASLYFVYTFRIFGSNKKPYDLEYQLIYYPITTVENAMWEFRWLVTCLLGILRTRKAWREMFEGGLKKIKLGEDRWKKVKCFSRCLAFALLFMWALNVFEVFVEIKFSGLSRANMALAIFVDSFMALLDRILAFPLFFLFCVTMYILCCMVEEYRHDIGTWGKGEEKSESSSEDADSPVNDENTARARFREIKDAIRNTGLIFEPYLMVHFLLLVCTFFLGVCACFEQMEVKIAENYTMPLPFQVG